MDIRERFKVKRENWTAHETDLYILPEDDKQREEIVAFLKENKIYFWMSWSNVKGQLWYGKSFIDIPFWLLDERIERGRARR